MSKTSINIFFVFTLIVVTVPATFLGRFLAELGFSWYFFVIDGRFPIYDALLGTTFGHVVKIFLTEGIILFVGLYTTAAVSLRLFQKRKNEIHFGGFWILHCLSQITLLLVLGSTAVEYPAAKGLILLGGTLFTGCIYLAVYKAVWSAAQYSPHVEHLQVKRNHKSNRVPNWFQNWLQGLREDIWEQGILTRVFIIVIFVHVILKYFYS